MRYLTKYKKVNTYKEIPTKGTYVILTRSQAWLARAIQGFMRLYQWIRGSRDTDAVPNHADGVFDGYAVGALQFGVDGNYIPAHYKDDKNPVYYIIRPVFTKAEEADFILFLGMNEKEKYAYLDLLKYAWFSLTNKWLGTKESLNRYKWTCFSLVASALNYAYHEEVFPNPYRITPVEFCEIVDKLHGDKFI